MEIGIGPEACGACPSPDGNTMYYYGPDGIRRCHWDGASWSSCGQVANVNSPYGGFNPVFNGGKLFLATFLVWGEAADIFVSNYDGATDQFDAPVPVTELNSPYEDVLLWISPDSNFVIFVSSRSGGYGGFDLYSAEWNPLLGRWDEIRNLGPEINTAADDTSGHM